MNRDIVVSIHTLLFKVYAFNSLRLYVFSKLSALLFGLFLIQSGKICAFLDFGFRSSAFPTFGVGFSSSNLNTFHL